MENVNKHYKETKIEPFEVIDDWDLDFYLGNVIKYIQRHKRKGKPKEDIYKAIVYINKYYEKL